ncbi:hypothetical protein Tco_1234120 [Tanacetum coccineum]
MHFVLTTLKVSYLLSTPMPEFVENEKKEQTRKRCKWENDYYICRGHILNCMDFKHNNDELALVQLGRHFRREESLRAEESGKSKCKVIDGSSSVNMMEDGKNKNNNKNSKEKKRKNDGNNDGILIHHKDDAFAWWIDLGATCHTCKDRCWFDTFHPVQDGSILHMGDDSTKLILGGLTMVVQQRGVDST